MKACTTPKLLSKQSRRTCRSRPCSRCAPIHRRPVQTERTFLPVIFVLPHKRPWNDSPERWHVAVCSNRYLDVDRFRVCSTPKRFKNVYLSSDIDRPPPGRCSTVPPCRRDVIYFWNRGWVDSGDWNGWRNVWWWTDVGQGKERLNFFFFFFLPFRSNVIKETTLFFESPREHVVRCFFRFELRRELWTRERTFQKRVNREAVEEISLFCLDACQETSLLLS